MTSYPDYPTCLSEGDFAIIRFGLELQGGGYLGLDHLLGIGPQLRHAARDILGPRAAHLFNPPLSADPVALRRFQKPAPGFVLRPDPSLAGELLEGDTVDFEVLLLGSAIQSLGDLLQVMQQLGRCGLTGATLRFDVTQVRALGLDGQWRQVWCSPRSDRDLAPEVMRLDAWLEQVWPGQGPVTLDFTTPLRLITQGRVLRCPRFSQLFPFLMRRVTAMLHAHCHLEPVETPARVLAAAGEVNACWKALGWSDWRETGDLMRLGGVTGRLLLNGEGLEKILWVVLLATLFGVGKGATYGAGRCCTIAAV